MAKLHFFSDKLRQIARNQYKLHGFLKEWQVVIYLLIVLKLAAMAFSVFAGYEYLKNFFVELLNNDFTANILACITLLLLEFLTMYWLSKFWKFALRLKLKTALLPFFGAVLFFSVSFILSTNGLAIRQSSKVDNTKVLTHQYEDKTLNSNALYESKRNEIKEQIATIKANPQGWSKGKRTILLDHQLKQIDKYYSVLQDVEGEHKNKLLIQKQEYQDKLNLNQANITLEADKYYKIVSVLMVIILLVNGLLMFFYGRVWNETEKEQATNEAISDFSADIELKTTDLIQTRIKDVFSMFISALQNQFDDNSPQIASNQKKPVFIGFKGQTEKNAQIAPGMSKKQPHGRNTPVKYKGASKQFEHGSAICPNCSKTFQKNSYNHKFCVELCRIEFWEKKNKKDYSRYKKLHE